MITPNHAVRLYRHSNGGRKGLLATGQGASPSPTQSLFRDTVMLPGGIQSINARSISCGSLSDAVS